MAGKLDQARLRVTDRLKAVDDAEAPMAHAASCDVARSATLLLSQLAELVRREDVVAEALGLQAWGTWATLASLLRALSSAPRRGCVGKRLSWFVGAVVDSRWSQKIEECDSEDAEHTSEAATASPEVKAPESCPDHDPDDGEPEARPPLPRP